MNILRNAVVFLGLAISMGSCFEPSESDFQKNIERDDQLMRDYLSRNNIEATETPIGYYYIRNSSSDIGNQIVNNDVVGVYYEIKTTDGQLIDNYMDESKAPRLYKHGEGGLIPRALNFASGLAKEGEEFTLYIPSYLAYQDYSFQQLILPNSNLVVKVKYVKAYSEEELESLEEEMIKDYLDENDLDGFERTEGGLYVKITKPGEEDAKVAVNGDIVSFTYKLLQLDSESPIAESPSNNNPFQISLGNNNNLKFLNAGLVGVSKAMEIEVISPSQMGYGGTIQVFPYQIRKDLFDKAILTQIARPYEPLLFRAVITDVR